MSLMNYRVIFRYHLMISLFPIDEVCPDFRIACLVAFGDHPLHFKELSCINMTLLGMFFLIY